MPLQLRKEHCKFKVSLIYLVRSSLTGQQRKTYFGEISSHLLKRLFPEPNLELDYFLNIHLVQIGGVLDDVNTA